MSTPFVLASIATVLLFLLTLFVFRRKEGPRKKVVIIGEKGTGKTRIFLALINRKDKEEKTIPSIDSTRKSMGSTILIDTPGRSTFEDVDVLKELSPKDTVLYVFNKKEKDIKKIEGEKRKIIKVYTGSDHEAPKDSLSIEIKEGISQSSINTLLKALSL